MNPTRRLAKILAQLLRLTLQQRDFTHWRLWLRTSCSNTATHIFWVGHTPFGQPCLQIYRWTVIRDQKFGHVKTDATSTNNSDTLANGRFATQHIYIGQHIGAILTGDRGITRNDTCRDHHLVKPSQSIHISNFAQTQLNASFSHHRLVIRNQAPKFFFAWNLLGHIQLTTDLPRFFKNTHLMPALGQSQRR